eukprot:CAMPEP_0170316014 /NCGR_PEP_ID=MMETSP0116_2-20130129/58622_1 /TAXON_ID=400756 /ORGANISM="Durinskia baltica, Strain CSIRO CS-38" /LENGTH=133 /DNA_ID=CAMNT_0010568547 /DNA_START=67 /DNA_END=466 /DNA_ORIENTATION=-
MEGRAHLLGEDLHWQDVRGDVRAAVEHKVQQEEEHKKERAAFRVAFVTIEKAPNKADAIAKPQVHKALAPMCGRAQRPTIEPAMPRRPIWMARSESSVRLALAEDRLKDGRRENGHAVEGDIEEEPCPGGADE